MRIEETQKIMREASQHQEPVEQKPADWMTRVRDEAKGWVQQHQGAVMAIGSFAAAAVGTTAALFLGRRKKPPRWWELKR